jgi:hypothetical protein
MKTGLRFNKALPEWLFRDIIGAEEGDDDKGGEGGSGDGADGDDPDDKGGDGGDGSGGDGDDPDDEGDFKSSESKKRLLDDYARVKREKKAADKELAKLKKAAEDADLKDKSEVEQAKTRAERAEKAAERLAEGYVKLHVNSALEKAARKANFKDPDDALAMIKLSDIGVEQDEDDPSDVDVDEKSVTDAIKALARRKPHLISDGTDDGEPSGSPHGRGGRRNRKDADEELATRYPSLQQ